jgi:hypothetical protein
VLGKEVVTRARVSRSDLVLPILQRPPAGSSADCCSYKLNVSHDVTRSAMPLVSLYMTGNVLHKTSIKLSFRATVGPQGCTGCSI